MKGSRRARKASRSAAAAFLPGTWLARVDGANPHAGLLRPVLDLLGVGCGLGVVSSSKP